MQPVELVVREIDCLVHEVGVLVKSSGSFLWSITFKHAEAALVLFIKCTQLRLFDCVERLPQVILDNFRLLKQSREVLILKQTRRFRLLRGFHSRISLPWSGSLALL